MLPEGGMDLVAMLHGQVSTLVLADIPTSLDQEISIICSAWRQEQIFACQEFTFSVQTQVIVQRYNTVVYNIIHPVTNCQL